MKIQITKGASRQIKRKLKKNQRVRSVHPFPIKRDTLRKAATSVLRACALFIPMFLLLCNPIRVLGLPCGSLSRSLSLSSIFCRLNVAELRVSRRRRFVVHLSSLKAAHRVRCYRQHLAYLIDGESELLCVSCDPFTFAAAAGHAAAGSPSRSLTLSLVFV